MCVCESFFVSGFCYLLKCSRNIFILCFLCCNFPSREEFSHKFSIFLCLCVCVSECDLWTKILYSFFKDIFYNIKNKRWFSLFFIWGFIVWKDIVLRRWRKSCDLLEWILIRLEWVSLVSFSSSFKMKSCYKVTSILYRGHHFHQTLKIINSFTIKAIFMENHSHLIVITI